MIIFIINYELKMIKKYIYIKLLKKYIRCTKDEGQRILSNDNEIKKRQKYFIKLFTKIFYTRLKFNDK